MYRTRVPAYVYSLPCGPDHRFRSFTRSEPADEDGDHWFYCRKCRAYVAIEPWRLVEYRPPRSEQDPRALGDGELGRRMDKAIQRDRIAAVMRRTWGAVAVAHIVADLGVPENLVYSVSADLGIYASALRQTDSSD